MNEVKLIFDMFRDKYGIMIDVGAMNGCSCLNFVRNGWTVYAFEPNPEQRIFIEEQKKQNNYKNLVVEPTAVSNKNRQNIPFYLSNESKGISSLIPFHKTHVKKYNVNTIRLDDYMKKNKIDKVNFLKIDTEGYDYFVLQSFPWNICKPDVVICEFEDGKTKSTLNYSWIDMVHFLKHHGYSIIISEWYPIEKYGCDHQWRCFKKFPCELTDANGWGNIVAFKNLEHSKKFISSST